MDTQMENPESSTHLASQDSPNLLANQLHLRVKWKDYKDRNF